MSCPCKLLLSPWPALVYQVLQVPCVRDHLSPPKSEADGFMSESRNTVILEFSLLGLLNLMESTGWLFCWTQIFSKEGSFVGILLWSVLACICDCAVNFKLVEGFEVWC